MTDFYADHQAISAFAVRVTGHVDGVSQAGSYANTWVPVTDTADGAIFLNFTGTVRDVVAALTTAMATLRAVCEASGSELDATARFYRDTDTATAALLDAKQAAVRAVGPGAEPTR